MIYLATIGKIVFVMFFAVDETRRSMGYGSQILELVQERYPNKKIIITIERCDVEAADIINRIRRKKFYAANGYKETGYFIKLGRTQQEIIIRNGIFSKMEFRLFFLGYSNLTMWPKMWEKTKEK